MEYVFLAAWVILVIAVAIVTLLSLIPGKSWVLRVCDFPRAQVLTIGILLLATMLIMLGIGSVSIEDHPLILSLLMILLIASVSTQSWWALQFTQWRAIAVTESTNKPDCFHQAQPEVPGEHAIRVITANVDYTNSSPSEAMEQLMHWRPHVLTLVETDEQWDELIEEYRASHPFVIKELRGLGRGMAVLSRIPIESADVKYLVDDDRPSIWAELCIPDGPCIRLVVTHPAPPGLPKRHESGRHSSKKRDIELDLIASHIGERKSQHWILSGDFNDVGWSATTMRAKRVSGLLDPRVGRGMFCTFPASTPFLRYPIDHVLVSESFRLIRLARLENIGSDHLPLLADLEFVDQTGKDGPKQSRQSADHLVYSACSNTTREVRLRQPGSIRKNDR